jgi:hypothetical protein
LGGIIMLVEWIGAPKTPSSATLSEMINKGIAWSPTRELADAATAQLRSSGNARDVTLADDYRRLAVESRTTTWHMENWYRPIREWYAADGPVGEYKNEYTDDAVVLEVGLLNWEWHTNRLVVQVMMRLIDVGSGRVIGRARHWAFPKIGRAAEVLSADNAALKHIFLETARPLIADGLRDLRLLQ